MPKSKNLPAARSMRNRSGTNWRLQSISTYGSSPEIAEATQFLDDEQEEGLVVFTSLSINLASEAPPDRPRVQLIHRRVKRIRATLSGLTAGTDRALEQRRAAALEELRSFIEPDICPFRTKPYSELREPRQPPPADVWSFSDPDLDRQSPALAAPLRREIFSGVLIEMKTVVEERRSWLYHTLIDKAMQGIRICHERGWDTLHMLRWLAFDLCELHCARMPLRSARPGKTLARIENECELLCHRDTSPEGRIEYIEAMRDIVLARYQRNVIWGRKGDYKFRALKFAGEGAREYLRQEAAHRYAALVVKRFGRLKPNGHKPEQLAEQYPDQLGSVEVVSPVDDEWGLAPEGSEEISVKPRKEPREDFCRCPPPKLKSRHVLLIEERPQARKIEVPPLVETRRYVRFCDVAARKVIPTDARWWLHLDDVEPLLTEQLTQDQRRALGIELRVTEYSVTRRTATVDIEHHPAASFWCTACGKRYWASIASTLLEPERLFCRRCADFQPLVQRPIPVRGSSVRKAFGTEWACAACGTGLLTRRLDQTLITLRSPKSVRQIERPRAAFEQMIGGMHREFADNLRAMYLSAKCGERPTWKTAAETVGADGIDSRDVDNYSTRLKRRHAGDWSKLEDLRPKALPYYNDYGRKTREVVQGDKTPQERITAARSGIGWKLTARQVRESLENEPRDAGYRFAPQETFAGEKVVERELHDVVLETNASQWVNRRAEANIAAWEVFIDRTFLRVFGSELREPDPHRLAESNTRRLRKGVGAIYSHRVPVGWKGTKDQEPGWLAAPPAEKDLPPVPFPRGAKVHHPKFGRGTVRGRSDDNGAILRAANGRELRDDRHVMVSFGPAIGLKTLDLEIAKSLLTITK